MYTVDSTDNLVPYKQITDYIYLTDRIFLKRPIFYAHLKSKGDPCCMISRQNTIQLFKKNEALGPKTLNVRPIRRLYTHYYYNMNQFIGQALATYRRISQKVDRIVQVGNIGPTASGD